MNKQRALLLDRDGIINRDTGYVGTIAEFDFLPGVFPFLREVRDQGYRLAILTNQSGVARGVYRSQDYENVTAFMLALLGQEGVDIDLILACFEHPEGSVPPYVRASFWRKPNPGMVLDAIGRMNLDPSRSAFLGDRVSDMQAAQKAGIRQSFWLTHENPPLSNGIKVVRHFSDVLKDLSL